MRPAIPVGGDVGGHGNDNKRPDSGWVCSFYRLLVFAAFTMRRKYLPKERQAQRPARNSTAAARDGYIHMGAWNDLQHGQPSWAPADASLRTSQYQHGPVAAHGRPVAAPNEGRRCFFLFFCNRAVSLLHLHALLVSQRLFCRPYGVHIGREGSFKTCSRPIAGISVCIFCRKGYWEGAEGGGMVSRQVCKRIVVKCCASARRATVQIGCDSAIYQLAASVVVYCAVVLVSWEFATSRGRKREDLLGNALQRSRSDACSSSRPAGESPARVARVTIK